MRKCFVFMIASFATLCVNSGCSNVSEHTFGGVFISQSYPHAGYVFNRNGADFGLHLSYNPQTNSVSGDALLQHANFSLAGTTIRIEGGSETPLGQMALSRVSDAGGRVVILLNITDSGQALEFHNSDGRVDRYVRQ